MCRRTFPFKGESLKGNKKVKICFFKISLYLKRQRVDSPGLKMKEAGSKLKVIWLPAWGPFVKEVD